mgnify:CR=1 FL=1
MVTEQSGIVQLRASGGLIANEENHPESGHAQYRKKADRSGNMLQKSPFVPNGYCSARFQSRGVNPNDLHVVVTGRNAKPELIEAADLVTDMTLVKHHFAAGVKAQPGIEF